jgi:hypothetical protein
MARYRVLETSYIGDRLYEAGAEIDFGDLPGSNLEPLDAQARKAAKAAEALMASAEKYEDIEGEEAAALDLV